MILQALAQARPGDREAPRNRAQCRRIWSATSRDALAQEELHACLRRVVIAFDTYLVGEESEAFALGFDDICKRTVMDGCVRSIDENAMTEMIK